MSEPLQERMDAAVDEVLNVLEAAQLDGVEINPLTTIISRLQARGSDLDLSEMDPLARMVVGGMLEQ